MYTFQKWNLIVSHLGLAYVSLVLMLVGFAVANAIDSVSNPDRETDNPIGSIIRASKRVIGGVGTLLIIASLAGKSPFLIVGGLGAFMAVFMLVFKDYLLGLVSSIQIIANRVVKVGDWVSMPSYDADGEVQTISLTLIKVQNADKTISTIPTSAILKDSFQNWAGVESSGGRRIKRSILIDMRQIQVCTSQMIDRFGRIELIQDYLALKENELEEYNDRHQIEASAVNSRRLTNIGTFRAYLDHYLRCHPGLNPDMPMLVRHLQPGSIGLPIEIYAFCNSTDWSHYESIQADIFDHLLAILPEFELRVFQELAEFEAVTPKEDLSVGAAQAGLAELESLVVEKNRELEKNSRTRPSSRIDSIRRRIADLDLSEKFAVESENRRITLVHLGDC
jgi:miniconductance mechanosensitive channel